MFYKGHHYIQSFLKYQVKCLAHGNSIINTVVITVDKLKLRECMWMTRSDPASECSPKSEPEPRLEQACWNQNLSLPAGCCPHNTASFSVLQTKTSFRNHLQGKTQWNVLIFNGVHSQKGFKKENTLKNGKSKVVWGTVSVKINKAINVTIYITLLSFHFKQALKVLTIMLWV